MLTAEDTEFGRLWFAKRWLPLELASFLIPYLLFAAGVWKFAAALVAIAFAVAQLWPSYYRLKDAGLPTSLLAIDFLLFNFGPSWDGLGFMKLYISHLIYLVVPAICLMAPSKRAVVPDNPVAV